MKKFLIILILFSVCGVVQAYDIKSTIIAPPSIVIKEPRRNIQDRRHHQKREYREHRAIELQRIEREIKRQRWIEEERLRQERQRRWCLERRYKHKKHHYWNLMAKKKPLFRSGL